MYLHLLPLLSLASVTLALTFPHPSERLAHQKREYCTPNTTRQPWSLSRFSTFTANATASDPVITRYSYILFTFSDPNNGVEVSCGRTIPSSFPGSIVDPDNFYECNGEGGGVVEYLYYGDGITLQESVECGNETVVATGSSVVSLVCSAGDAGEEEGGPEDEGVECVLEGEVLVPFRLG